ncbi:MAG: hypothetical protein QG552_519 [Thermodesulfobacteriota bacterium]|nr:hypothetical protein [Thermodesulfobacteriota bacterium]
MKGHHASPLLILTIVVFMAGGAFFSLFSVTLLTVENPDRSEGPSLWVRAPQRFEMFYVQSMYGHPVKEDFRIEGNRIVLEGIRTGHAGIMEYYGYEDLKDLSGLNRDLGSCFTMQIGLQGGQGLSLGEKTLFLEEMGTPGDRVRVAVKAVPLWRWILTGIRQD